MLVLSGAMSGFTVSMFLPHRYEATARLVFTRAYQPDAARLFDGASEVTLLPQSLELMIRRSPAFKNRLYLESVGEIVAETRANLVIASEPEIGSAGATIRFEDDDVDTALDVTRFLLSDFSNNAARMANARNVADIIRITRVPAAHLTGLTPWRLTGAGTAIGFAVSLLIWILLPRLKTQPVSGPHRPPEPGRS